MPAPILEYLSVFRRLGGRPVLDGFTLSVAEGETVALVGPSGSGKTTALKLANRLLEPDAGEVRVFGQPATDREAIALRREIGWVIQEGGLFPHWTVEENVAAVPRLLGWPAAKRRERAVALLETVGLPAADFARRRPRELSGGQRQRVGVARALAADPRLVLMDEPFGALDPPSRRAIQDEFRSWRARSRAAVLFVTHDVAEAFRLADRIAVLASGSVRQVGHPEELRRHPVDELVRGFVSGTGP
ncbi:MAG TPA: ATP-binding cassette domain-containing protein [Thermoanaerobaculia bacterium]|nr:ATP-binding cassette domain-containing protein [Thermoanaerobaculia bacterium]